MVEQREEELHRQTAETEQEEEERRIREHEMRARRTEAKRSAEDLRAEQLRADQQARAQRQSAGEAEQQLLQIAARGSRTHSVMGGATPKHRISEEVFRSEVRGRVSEAT